jgi:hypothetical protein
VICFVIILTGTVVVEAGWVTVTVEAGSVTVTVEADWVDVTVTGSFVSVTVVLWELKRELDYSARRIFFGL